MEIIEKIQNQVTELLKDQFELELLSNQVVINKTRRDVAGDLTLVMFPFVKQLKKSPQEIGDIFSQRLSTTISEIKAIEIAGGFLNISLSDEYWNKVLKDLYHNPSFGTFPKNGKKILVEFSSPNTNKPLHLGHIRNILLGWSTSKISEAAGYKVIKTQIINDRGIAICKSMLAWQLFGEGKTPDSSNIKGDHFVGSFYVAFETHFKNEYNDWQNSAEAKNIFESESKENESYEAFLKRFKNEYFNRFSALGNQAKTMLQAWENDDPDIKALWKQMNSWVYDGFNTTYEALGVNFDALYYESDTYKLGKDIIENGLQDEVFYKKEDGSVWIDLESKKLDHKLVLRSDGTSVYMTQDIGTAQLRYKDHGVDSMIYVVADEQDYHFKVLFEILKELKEPYTDGLHHLSYGMVDLPTGKMKSREGTVVDADDLIKEVIDEARTGASDRGVLESISIEEREDIYRKIGLGALKFFILKVNPKKRMIFDPKDSVDMQGQTGPYIQNAVVRIESILRKLSDWDESLYFSYSSPLQIEKDLVKSLNEYPSEVLKAAEDKDPSIIASFAYELAKDFHKFYHDVRILKAESHSAKAYRVVLCTSIKNTLTKAMDLLGIEMPERM